MQIRELTGREKQAIQRLVKTMCANYCTEHGCLPLYCDCIMFGKAYSSGALCKWFYDAVLPLDAKLERVFSGGIMLDTKPCAICGKAFPLHGRQIYCSDKCTVSGRRKSVAVNVRAYRERKRICNHLTLKNSRDIKSCELQNSEVNTNYREEQI